MVHQGQQARTGSASWKGNKTYPVLLVQPQSQFTYILLSSPMVCILESHAFTSVETIIDKYRNNYKQNIFGQRSALNSTCGLQCVGDLYICVGAPRLSV